MKLERHTSAYHPFPLSFLCYGDGNALVFHDVDKKSLYNIFCRVVFIHSSSLSGLEVSVFKLLFLTLIGAFKLSTSAPRMSSSHAVILLWLAVLAVH